MYQVPEPTLTVLYEFAKEYCDMIGFDLTEDEEKAMDESARILGRYSEQVSE
jgi:hypothetical protein